MADEKLDVLDEMPKQVQFMQRTMMAIMERTSESSVANKITEKHIEQMLDIQRSGVDNQRLGMELQVKDNDRNRLLALAVVLAILALAALVLILYKDQPDMVQKIIIPAITFIAGAGGGYGLGKSKRAE